MTIIRMAGIAIAFILLSGGAHAEKECRTKADVEALIEEVTAKRNLRYVTAVDAGVSRTVLYVIDHQGDGALWIFGADGCQSEFFQLRGLKVLAPKIFGKSFEELFPPEQPND